jgi:hypothetical protein
MTIRCLRASSVVLFAWLLAASDAGAQSPWQVTVTPTLNPLPIGLCGAVQIAVKDATGAIPRNGLGARVSLADFEMTVTAAGTRSVAGQQIDASHWSVCACTGASAGAAGTVTATYPSPSLPVAARVPGVAFKTIATFTIAPAKGGNPPACTAPPAKLVSAPAASPAPTRNTAAAPASSAAAANSSQPGGPPSQPAAPPSQPAIPPAPAVPAQIPEFPDSLADWAALQKSLGSQGWAELQKAIDAAMDETPENTDDKPPPGVPKEMLGGGRNHAAAVAAFKKLAPVLRHDRCANCHTDITYWDEPAHDDMPAKTATHKGGDINEIAIGVKDSYGNQEVKFMPCQDCHTKAPQAWDNSGPIWTGLDDYQLCQKLKQSMFNGEVLLDHLRTDALIKLAFQGQRAMDLTPQPPPLSHSQFMQYATEWINRMDAM